jgi:FlaA1/EpsC-like NDP-sugar epimerase
MYLKIATLPRKIKILFMLLADLILIPFALWSAIALRLGTFTVPMETIWWIFIVIPIFTIPLFIKLGLYRAVIRYFDEKILLTVILGVTLSVFLITAVVVMTQTPGIPRSSIVIYWVISVTYITLSRYLARGIIRQFERKDRRRQKVAIYGAGRAGLQTALSMMSSAEYQPILFFDDNSEMQGTTLAGIRVHKPEKAIALMAEHECYQLLFAIPSASIQQRQKIIRQFQQQGIQLKIIPSLNDIVNGQFNIQDIREVGVEDLLGRDPVPADETLISKIITNRTILITGGGGSIGSELCRQILARNPEKIVIYEQNEFSLYAIEKELLQFSKKVEIISILGDVLDTAKLNDEIKNHSIDVVYHAGAYKHVPLVEKNILAGVTNNVLGTLSVLNAIENTTVKNFILISTDKAVRPTNVMGATKRIAEMCVQMFSEKNKDTIFSMVRFGNVLGSSGSVIPLFKEQIKAGGPVTVTDPEITRFFMTIPEACELVLQASSMAEGGDLFILDMGEPVKIVDLAKNMIRLSGFSVRDFENPEGDIAIEFVGLRSGEKLYEELLIGKESLPTKHARILKAKEISIPEHILQAQLTELKKLCDERDTSAILTSIKIMVANFSHQLNENTKNKG